MKKENNPKKAVVLLSGGLDSATVLYHAKAKGYECHCLLFRYGQRHEKELKAARQIAKKAGCFFHVIAITLPWCTSSLTDRTQQLPSGHRLEKKAMPLVSLPTTYVPGRNTIFISFALSFAETIGAGTIFIGANAVDYSGYPDCRPDYYTAWNRLLRSLGTTMKIQTPLIRLTKEGIIRAGLALGVPYGLTWSCYKGASTPCGECDSCRYRAKGFRKAGIGDPALKKLT